MLKEREELVSQNKKAYFQGGGGENEPTPGKKKYKSDKAIVVQPRFEEPFYRNYDAYDTEGVNGPAKHGPGSGWHHMHEYKSIKEFLEHSRKKLKDKYKADDSWIEDNSANRKERIEKMKTRASLLTRLIKTAGSNEKFAIDFAIDDQIKSSPIIGEMDSYPASAQIGGYLDKYLPQDDFEDKSPDKLDFGRDYTEDDPGANLNFDDLEKFMTKYLSSKEPDLYGLPDGIDSEDKDSDITINHINPYAGETDSGNTMYEDKWNI